VNTTSIVRCALFVALILLHLYMGKAFAKTRMLALSVVVLAMGEGMEIVYAAAASLIAAAYALNASTGR
jgi:hypothetical protein